MNNHCCSFLLVGIFKLLVFFSYVSVYAEIANVDCVADSCSDSTITSMVDSVSDSGNHSDTFPFQTEGDLSASGVPDSGSELGTDEGISGVDSLAEIVLPEQHNKITKRKQKEELPEGLYPGISPEQDRFALQMVRHLFSFNWDEAEKVSRRMQRLERKEHLPPLSYLLLVSGYVIRIHNGDYRTDGEREALMEQVGKQSRIGLNLSNPVSITDSLLPTYLLIHSGIKGFTATLKISKNPVEAALEGFGALKMLEKLTSLNPAIKDAFLGLGIFYCALANAPPIVRGAINVTGRAVSFDTGLEYLRQSAYDGRYTTEIAKQYLIQFLSPYWGHLAGEKRAIFESLQKAYPRNPYYMFLEADEYICFHPENLNEVFAQKLRKKLANVRSSEYCSKRYALLLNWQGHYLDSALFEKPDSTLDLREFTYYPLFLEALREKENLIGTGKLQTERVGKVRLTKRGAGVLRILEASDMSSSRKNFFSWHVRDALRMD